MEWMPAAIREGILVVLFISGPMVILAAGLGLTIGILQAATQVQEQTLGSAAKVLGIFAALILFGFFMFNYLSQYAERAITKAFKLVPGLSAHPLPRRNPFDRAGSVGNQNAFNNAEAPYLPELDLADPQLPGGRASLFSDIANQADIVPVDRGGNFTQELAEALGENNSSFAAENAAFLDAQELTIEPRPLGFNPRELSPALEQNDNSPVIGELTAAEAAAIAQANRAAALESERITQANRAAALESERIAPATTANPIPRQAGLQSQRLTPIDLNAQEERAATPALEPQILPQGGLTTAPARGEEQSPPARRVGPRRNSAVQDITRRIQSSIDEVQEQE